MRLVALIKSMGDVDQSWGGGTVLLWIFAEANMSCIVASLPTVKPLLNHLAPRLLGSSSTPKYPVNSGSGLANPDAPPTFGGTGNSSASKTRRDKYQRFRDDIMYPLETVVAAEGGSDSGSDGGRQPGANTSQTAIVTGDSAILQTKTTTVKYERRT
ncbi:hypothetical protein C8A05DRAFT_40159 [Staphylotrichum tortipilum]|uniref:Uncharacterized protein n=1 Tax=Staphylotrichum tortipilum TaxID=2831512 RepID=A0AAN6M7K0_9PEZI|nr:hypothetical protein C8A05DRAFT_40159 [Staphylotrichum longicolle]